MQGSRHGFVLVFCVGVLALMSIVSTAFVMMTGLERTIAASYVDVTRAQLLAESGFEAGVQRIQSYRGGALLPAEKTELRDALAMKKQVQIGSQTTQVSGVLPGTYTANGDVYAVRMRDNSGKINLNDSDGRYNLDTDAAPDYRDPNAVPGEPGYDEDFANAPGRLYMLVKTLGGVLFNEAVGARMTEAIFAARPIRDYTHLHDTLVAPRILTQPQYDELLKHACLANWQDPTVVRPTYTVSVWYHDNSSFLDTMKYPLNPDGEPYIDLHTWDDYQTDDYELEPRSPVNINMASLEVIQAMVQPLRGWYLDETHADQSTEYRYAFWSTGLMGLRESRMGTELYGSPKSLHYSYVDEQSLQQTSQYGTLRLTPALTAAQAGAIATAIRNRANTRSFETWQEFEVFIRNLDGQGMPAGVWSAPFSASTAWHEQYYAHVMQDLVLAAFNPNTRLNDFNPDASRFSMIDKAQLTQYTTEACLEPTGFFDIESAGIVHDPRARALATRRLSATVRVFETLRLTQQSQFLAGLESNGDIVNHISTVASDQPATHGSGHFGNGLTLQAYPQPLLSTLRPREWLSSAFADGCLGLATLQTTDMGQLGNEPCLLDFAWPSDLFRFKPNEFGSYLTNNPHAGDLLRPLSPLTAHPNFHPDGIFSESRRTLAYPFNLFFSPADGGTTGSLQCWMKPNFALGTSTRVRKFLSLLQTTGEDGARSPSLGLWYFPHDFSDAAQTPDYGIRTGRWNWHIIPQNPLYCVPSDHPARWMTTRSLAWGYKEKASDWNCASASVVNITSDYSNAATHRLSSRPAENPFEIQPHAWHRLAVQWQLQSANAALPVLRMNLNGTPLTDSPLARAGREQCAGYVMDYMAADNRGYFRNFVSDDDGSFAAKINRCIRFGELSGVSSGDYKADATFDEIQIGANLLDSASVQAAYDAGRYHRPAGSAAGEINVSPITYTSPAIDVASAFRPDHRYRLRSSSYTYAIPLRNKSHTPAGSWLNAPAMTPNVPHAIVNPGEPNDPLHGKSIGGVTVHCGHPITLDFLENEETGNWVFHSSQPEEMPGYAGGSSLHRHPLLQALSFSKGRPLQFRAHFNIRHTSDMSTPAIYDMPYLDDVTFTFFADRVSILSWQANLSAAATGGGVSIIVVGAVGGVGNVGGAYNPDPNAGGGLPPVLR